MYTNIICKVACGISASLAFANKTKQKIKIVSYLEDLP